MDMNKMMKQVQKMQAELAKAQEELAQAVVEGSAGGGAVKVEFTGQEASRVTIDPAAPSVLLGGTAVRRQLLYPARFDGFSIPPARPDDTPGALTVGLTHGGGATAGYVRARHRNAWW